MHRVLIVDDDKEMVNAITRLLALTDNFEIRTACDGFMAMMRFKEWQPDVIVMDIRMPGLDGYELCRRIRTEDVGKGVKIFAISGMISDVEAGKLPAIGIDQFLAKPFDNTELLDKLYTLVNLPSDNR
ncbi:MAG: response regulator [Candidatus Omnitrophica bacterium]|nr:response regulator [Candidatus Omnitrophota bacterium]